MSSQSRKNYSVSRTSPSQWLLIKARAAETVNREVKNLPTDAEVLKISTQQYTCPRCGRQGHTRSTCYYRNKRCRNCNKVGHASAVCWHIQPQDPSVRTQQKRTTTKVPSKPTHAVVTTVSDSDEETTTNWQYTRHLVGMQIS